MKKLIIILSLLFLAVNGYCADITKTKTHLDGEILTAAHLNNNIDPIFSTINDLDGENLASDLAITSSGNMSFSGTVTTTGNTLLGNGADTLTINASTGITYTPVATWTFTGAQTVSGTWADLGIVTTVDINGGTIDGITDLKVVDGGSGAGTFTDGGVLLGSGTTTFTAMSVLGDGAIIVGDNSTDPVALTAFSSSTGDVLMAAGGTGASLTNDPGGVLYCGGSVLAVLANDAGSAKFLRCGATGSPAWDTVDIINETHSTLTIARGGTGQTSAAAALDALGGGGSQVFTGSGTFTAPTGVTTVYLTMVAGGGGGAGQEGGGGGGGQALINYPYTVTPAGEYAVAVGAAGASGDGPSGAAWNGGTGGASTFDSTVSVAGGGGGKYVNDGSTGGVGGGAGLDAATSTVGGFGIKGGDGGLGTTSGGGGGASHLGPGGAVGSPGNPPASGFGGGGGGGPDSQEGGDGKIGIVIVMY